MLTDSVTVVIPVGPQAIYKQFLPDCIESVKNQTVKPLDVIVVDDMAHLDYSDVPDCRLVRNDWLLGCSDSWNRGVALSQTDGVFLMGSDDVLMPTCLEDCLETYQQNNQKAAWYSVTYQLQDGKVDSIPINAAMVTKRLFQLTGGFPPTASVGGCDALCLSILIKHMPDRIIQVKPGKVNYWIRSHAEQETHRQSSFFLEEMNSVRNKETARWESPTWTK